MEPEGSLPCSQQPAIGHISDLNKSIAPLPKLIYTQVLILSLEDPRGQYKTDA